MHTISYLLTTKLGCTPLRVSMFADSGLLMILAITHLVACCWFGVAAWTAGVAVDMAILRVHSPYLCLEDLYRFLGNMGSVLR